jgi:hypothetical protein
MSPCTKTTETNSVNDPRVVAMTVAVDTAAKGLVNFAIDRLAYLIAYHLHQLEKERNGQLFSSYQAQRQTRIP